MEDNILNYQIDVSNFKLSCLDVFNFCYFSISASLDSTMTFDVKGYSETGIVSTASVNLFGAWNPTISYLPSSASTDKEHKMEIINHVNQKDFSFFDAK